MTDYISRKTLFSRTFPAVGCFCQYKRLKGRYSGLVRYHPCEVQENIILSFFAPWCSEFNFRIQLLHSFRYNPVSEQLTLKWTLLVLPVGTLQFLWVHPRAGCTQRDCRLYLGVPRLSAAEILGCSLKIVKAGSRNWILNTRRQTKLFLHLTGTIFIIWAELEEYI